MGTERLRVGLIGLGRLGRMYGQYLAQRVPGAVLAAVADHKAANAEAFARDFNVPRHYVEHGALLDDRSIDAVVVVSSTHTHKQVVLDAAAAGKAIFCEKPISLTLDGAREMIRAVEKSGVFFQMAFQRRFDLGYQAARRKVQEGAIGEPMMFTSISRDPYAPPIEFCNPKVSGGMISDMGVHDFDIARVFMGDVRRVHALGATLAYEEMKPIGDIDNAIIDLVFENGTLGVVQLSRKSVFGYDIRGEIWGTKGSIEIGYYRQTPILMLNAEGVSHDAVPYFMERFENAYLAQINDFVDHVQKALPPSVTGADAEAALRISLAANLSRQEQRPVELSEITN